MSLIIKHANVVRIKFASLIGIWNDRQSSPKTKGLASLMKEGTQNSRHHWGIKNLKKWIGTGHNKQTSMKNDTLHISSEKDTTQAAAVQVSPHWHIKCSSTADARAPSLPS